MGHTYALHYVFIEGKIASKQNVTASRWVIWFGITLLEIINIYVYIYLYL